MGYNINDTVHVLLKSSNTDAERYFKNALALNDNLWDIHAQYGEYLMNQKRYADAVPHFKKVNYQTPLCINNFLITFVLVLII